MSKEFYVILLFPIIISFLTIANPQDKLTRLRQIAQPLQIQDWRFYKGDVAKAVLPEFDDSSWEIVNVGHQWQPANSIAWFRKTITIPESIAGLPVANQPITLRVGVDDDGEIYIDGKLRQRFHWDEGKVTLTDSAKPGQKFTIAIKGINGPGNGQLLMATLQIPAMEQVAKIITALDATQRLKNIDQQQAEEYQSIYEQTLDAIDLKALQQRNATAFTQSLQKSEEIAKRAEPPVKQYVFHIIPQSHIDMAWLWRWPETVEVCEHTFSKALDLMQKYPDYTFAQSQAAAYKWMEEYHPKTFEDIKKRVKEGRWEIVGGMWVEPDLNMAAGESLVRQLLYGKRYFRQEFGVDVKVGWNPDSFGHSWQLPQILKKSGVDYYVHYRCSKGPLYWWESPDGSRVLVCPPGGDPFDFARQFGIKDCMHLRGGGDHGNGLEERDVTEVHQQNELPASPKIAFSRPSQFFQKITAQKPKLPTIKDELNFEFEGCYTSQGKTKYNNRKAEQLLFAAEEFSTIAATLGKKYPKTEFVNAWHTALFNQFHDILAGSSIHPVYGDAEKDYRKVLRSGQSMLRRALGTITSQIDTTGEGIPIIIFNPLSWTRTDIVEAEIQVPQDAKGIRLFDHQLKEIYSQLLEDYEKAGKKFIKILFVAKDMPAAGYKVYFAQPTSYFTGEIPRGVIQDNLFSYDTQFFKIEIDHKTGNIKTLFDKQNQREVLSKPANLLQVLEDKPPHMSAWIIGLTGKGWDLDQPESVTSRLTGTVQSKWQTIHKFQNSTFTQDIIVYDDLPRIDIKFHADWQEREKMLKVAFPTTITAEKATFEIPYATINRPTDGHEAPAITFVDLSDDKYGVAILNDCKYGYDVKNNTIRLSLLRSPTEPDPKADEGTHEILYSIYPHKGDWVQGEVLKRGWELNQPLIAIQTTPHKGTLPKEHSFFSLKGNAILTCAKQAEDDSDIILRLYEPYGKKAKVEINLPAQIQKANETNMLEEDTKPLSFSHHTLYVELSPYEIKTLKVKLKPF